MEHLTKIGVGKEGYNQLSLLYALFTLYHQRVMRNGWRFNCEWFLDKKLTHLIVICGILWYCFCADLRNASYLDIKYTGVLLALSLNEFLKEDKLYNYGKLKHVYSAKLH